jgi:hypothetical protein
MDQGKTVLKESTQVIREIEDQLDKLLRKRIGDVEHELEDRISREREAARKRKEEIEQDFRKEKQAITDYRTMVQQAEEERGGLLDQAREHFNRVIHLQAEIESLAKATVDEIKTVSEIQQEIETLREKTSERAAFLKKDLSEKYGISAEVLGEGPKPLSLDLDQELDKLRKIKELLAVETAAVGLGAAQASGKDAEAGPDDETPGAEGFRIPEIQDLIAASHAPEGEPAEPAAAESPETGPEAAPEPPAAAEDDEAEILAALESWRKSEPANGSGEIYYFEKDGRIVLDGESLFSTVEKSLDEAQRLSLKLGMTESPKGQFFIKQELINWQEGLRGLFLRIIKMTEKKAWALPSFTGEILNTTALRSLLERLSMENWSNPDEFSSFYAAVMEMRSAFLARLEPRGRYLRSLKRDIEQS